MYFVYALKSIKKNYIYVGMTKDLDKRLKEHQDGKGKATRPYRPFKMIYSEAFPYRFEARKREKFLKTGVGKEFLKKNFLHSF